MKWSTTIWLLALAVLLGALIWLGEREHVKKPAVREQFARVLKFTPAQVDDLEIVKGDFRVHLLSKDGTWYLVEPVQGRADSGEVERILGVLETLPRQDVVTDEERRQRDLDLADYGFSPPRARFTLRDRGNRQELLVGGDAPIGKTIYVKSASSDDVVSAPKELLSLIPDNLERLRDRAIMTGDSARTARLEIQRPAGGLIQLVQTRSGWMIQQPVTLRADGAKITRMLDALYALRAEKFVWDPPAAMTTTQKTSVAQSEMDTGARLETYGLAADAAQLRIQVWATGEQTGKELLVGKTVDETGTLVYVKQRDLAPIYAVASSLTNSFAVSVNDLRDRNLLAVEGSRIQCLALQAGDRKLALQRNGGGKWNITEPVQWKADDEFVNDLALKVSRLRVESAEENAETNLAAYGLEPPAFSILAMDHLPVAHTNEPATGAPAATADAADAEAPPPRLLVGTPVEGKENSYVMFEGSHTILGVAESSLRSFRFPLTEPLLYRDRTMLAVPDRTVWKLTLQKAGKEQTVLRSDSGEWTPVGAGSNVVNRTVVEDVLSLGGNLRALRIESHNPKYLASYGLDRTGITLTFGLSGSEGIQKTLILGFRARTDGVFATVQGQDVVFVLANAFAERLAKDLVRPAPADAESAVTGGLK